MSQNARKLVLEGPGTKRVIWSIGSAAVVIEHDQGQGALPIAVRCRFGSLLGSELAMLDTGAQFTIVGDETAELIADDFGMPLGSTTMSTRRGLFQGSFHRITIRLLADEGNDLTVDATCVVLKNWQGPNILGFRGLIERVRLALDPGGITADSGASARLFFGVE